MCTVGRGAEDCADDDERSCHEQTASATESVAQDADDDLADDVSWGSGLGPRSTVRRNASY